MRRRIVSISMPPKVHDKARKAAREDGRKLSNWVVRLIEMALAGVPRSGGSP